MLNLMLNLHKILSFFVAALSQPIYMNQMEMSTS